MPLIETMLTRMEGRFAWVCALLWDILGEGNNMVFRGLDKDPSEVWSLASFMFRSWLRFLSFFVIIP